MIIGIMGAGATPAKALLPAVKGQISLDVVSATPGAFDLDIAPGTEFLALLEAVSGDGSVFPDDGAARLEVKKFFLEIGDTFWNETMKPAGGPLYFTLLFGDGSVKGIEGEITPYDPAHADFGLLLPASPGTWKAVDVKTVIDAETGRQIVQDRGFVEGTYNVDNLVVVPVPGAMGLCGFGLLILGGRRLLKG
jgi:hypothetical protein